MDERVWCIVAEHVPAHPQRYTMLAQVNKSFHKIFMSDDLWTKLDFYEVGCRISEFYLTRSRYFTNRDKIALSEPTFGEIKKPTPSRCSNCRSTNFLRPCSLCGYWVEENCVYHVSPYRRDMCAKCELLKSLNDSTDKYVLYMAAANYPDIVSGTNTTKFGDKVRLLLIEECGLLKFANETDYEDTDLVKKALIRNPAMLQYAPTAIRNDVDIACLAIGCDFSTYKLLEEDARRTPKVFQTYLMVVRWFYGAQSLYSS